MTRQRVRDGKASIFKAAQEVDVDRIRELLWRGWAHADDMNVYRMTPLHYVVLKSCSAPPDLRLQRRCVVPPQYYFTMEQTCTQSPTTAGPH